MVKRTTISVPDKLYKKMDKWRNSINFSKEFQNHISKLIEKKEELEEIGDIEMQEIIERLREQKMAVTEPVVDYTEMGYEDGFKWAKQAGYDDIQDVLKWDPAEKSYPSTDHDGFVDYFQMVIIEDELMDFEDWNYDRPNEYISDWMNGWKDGVEAFWNKVKDLV